MVCGSTKLLKIWEEDIMDKDKVASLEYMVMNPLVEEAMEPDYDWTLMSELVLSFPNWEEFLEGNKVLVDRIYCSDDVRSVKAHTETMQIWITFK